MSNAPKRGRGRPATRSAEEKRLAKQIYDQERYRRLKAEPIDLSGDSGIQVGIAEAPTALTGALTGPTGPTVSKKPLPASSSCPQEPVFDNYPSHEPNDSPQLDSNNGGGYIGSDAKNLDVDDVDR